MIYKEQLRQMSDREFVEYVDKYFTSRSAGDDVFKSELLSRLNQVEQSRSLVKWSYR